MISQSYRVYRCVLFHFHIFGTKYDFLNQRFNLCVFGDLSEFQYAFVRGLEDDCVKREELFGCDKQHGVKNKTEYLYLIDIQMLYTEVLQLDRRKSNKTTVVVCVKISKWIRVLHASLNSCCK